MRFLVKLIVSAFLIALASEFAKKSPKMGGLIISLPLTSILAIFWLYLDTNNEEIVFNFSKSILIFLIPSLAFFVVIMILLKVLSNFYLSFIVATISTIFAYYLYYAIID